MSLILMCTYFHIYFGNILSLVSLIENNLILVRISFIVRLEILSDVVC